MKITAHNTISQYAISQMNLLLNGNPSIREIATVDKSPT